ncbi:MAG: ATP-binding protein, partial [Planctomycetota bacterium]|nr:ATP-binding protein [Planctomycetota bacterium]
RRACRCTERQIGQYAGKISGPLLDRIDLHVEAAPVDREKLMERRSGATSREIAEEVASARAVQSRRYAGRPTPVNAAMTPGDIGKFCLLDGATETILKSAVAEFGLSARAFSRILKVARTIADLEGAESILMDHVLEAVQYRRADVRA